MKLYGFFKKNDRYYFELFNKIIKFPAYVSKSKILRRINEILAVQQSVHSILLERNYNILSFKDLYYLNFYNELKKMDNISELYFNLIKNLDAESISLVNRCLNIMQKADGKTACKILDFPFETEGKKKILEMESSIVKLASDMYFYKKYILPVNIFPPEVFLTYCGFKEFTGIDRKKAIIDAGAFIGDSALILSEYTDSYVYAFEPIDKLYDMLVKTIQYNKLDNKIIPIKNCLSSCAEEIEIYFSDDMINGCSSVDNVRKLNNKQKVSSITLDNFVKDRNIEVGGIKIDIEGAEQLFLQGAMETIKSQRPFISIAIYHNVDDFFKIKVILENLGLNYKFKIVKGNAQYPLCGELTLLCMPQ